MWSFVSVIHTNPSRSTSMLCPSGKRWSPHDAWSLPSRLNTRTCGLESLMTRIDPLPSAATEDVSPQSGAGGVPKSVTSYLGLVVCARLAAAIAHTISVMEMNILINGSSANAPHHDSRDFALSKQLPSTHSRQRFLAYNVVVVRGS